MPFELLEKYRSVIWNCQVCGVCQRGPWNPYPPRGPTSDRLCPEYERFRTLTHSALGRIQVARWIMEGIYQPDEEFTRVVYDCLLCGACSTVGCVVDKEHVPLFRDLRTELARVGLGPPETFRKTAEMTAREGNRFGRPAGERGRWVEGVELPEKADTVYFAGCVASYRSPELARATFRLLQAIEIPFTILGQGEKCCGNPLLSSGQMETFELVASRNVEAIRDKGARRVITSCGCCYSVLKFDYPRLSCGADFEVVHITEFLAEAMRNGRMIPEKALPGKIAYHDPCHLARMGGRVIREPRQVLSGIPGAELVEMEGSGRDTQCCGRYPVELPELSLFTGANRLRDAETAGASTVVTACSFCDWNLSRAARSLKSDIRVVDITQLMVESLGL